MSPPSGDLSIYLVHASDWPGLATRFAFGDDAACALWAGIRPVYERHLAGLAVCGGCSAKVRRGFTTAVGIDRSGVARVAFALCRRCGAKPDTARRVVAAGSAANTTPMPASACDNHGHRGHSR